MLMFHRNIYIYIYSLTHTYIHMVNGRIHQNLVRTLEDRDLLQPSKYWIKKEQLEKSKKVVDIFTCSCYTQVQVWLQSWNGYRLFLVWNPDPWFWREHNKSHLQITVNVVLSRLRATWRTNRGTQLGLV